MGARSKRNRKYTFSNRVKKDMSFKEGLVEKVRHNAKEFNRMIVFQFINPRTDLINELRRKFRKSIFMMGKNKVLQIGLGRTVDDEIEEDMHKVSEQLIGQRGILFTNEPLDDILKFFNEYEKRVHSRPGSMAPKTVTLDPGLLEMFTFSQEPFLRKLGLVTKLSQVGGGAGIPELLVPYTICKKGKRLKPNQATLLKLLGYNDAKFHVRVFCCWERSNHGFIKFGLKEGKMVKQTDDDSDIDEMTTDDEVSEEEEELDDDELMEE